MSCKNTREGSGVWFAKQAKLTSKELRKNCNQCPLEHMIGNYEEGHGRRWKYYKEGKLCPLACLIDHSLRYKEIILSKYNRLKNARKRGQ